MSDEPVASFFRIEELVVQVDVIRMDGREDRSQAVVSVGEHEQEWRRKEVDNKLT